MSLILSLCLLCSALFSAIPAGAAPAYTPEITQGTVSFTDPHATFVLDITVNCLGNTPSSRKFFFDITLRPTTDYAPGDYEFELIFGKEMSGILFTTTCKQSNGFAYNLNPTYQMRDRVDKMGYSYMLPSYNNGWKITEYHIFGECQNVVLDWNWTSYLGYQYKGADSVLMGNGWGL